MEKIAFKIRFLTPVWSGDVFGKSERLRQTAILGSLRYIGEALLRGLDLFVCPTINQNKSRVNNCIYKGENKNLCAGCYFWGATGWQRQFRFYIDGKYNIKTYKANSYWLSEVLGKGENTFKVIQFENYAVIEFFPLNTYNCLLDEIGVNTEDYIHLLMYVSSQFGTLGSKARTGFGFFEVVEGIDTNKVVKGLKALKQNKDRIHSELRNISREDAEKLSDLPNISKFVRYDMQIKDVNNFLQKLTATLNFRNSRAIEQNISFKQFVDETINGWYIKYFIRKKIRQNKEIENKYKDILGSKEQGSLFYVSSIYKENGNFTFRVILEDETKAQGFEKFLEDIFKPIDVSLQKIRRF